MTTKAKLVQALENARAVEVALVGEKTDREKTARGSMEDWSLKDTIAHILTWRKQLALRLEAVHAGETPALVGSSEAVEAINQQGYNDYQDVPWPEIWSESQEMYAQMLTLVEKTSEPALFEPGRFDWLEGRPLWRTIAVNGFAHPLTHISERYLGEGKQDQAIEIERFSTETGLTMDESPSWRGGMWYNLACFYVKISDADAALTLLQEAFILNPELKAWGKQDPDLAPLRENPDFVAMYEGE